MSRKTLNLSLSHEIFKQIFPLTLSSSTYGIFQRHYTPKMQQTCTRLEAWRIDTVYSNTKCTHISDRNKNISPLAVAELAE